LLDRPHERLEHEVEAAGLREVALWPFTRTDGRLERAARLFHLVRAEPRLALAAVDERIREARHVSARFPHARMHEDACIQPLDVITLVDHRAPPRILHVPLELHAQ